MWDHVLAEPREEVNRDQRTVRYLILWFWCILSRMNKKRIKKWNEHTHTHTHTHAREKERQKTWNKRCLNHITRTLSTSSSRVFYILLHVIWAKFSRQNIFIFILLKHILINFSALLRATLKRVVLIYRVLFIPRIYEKERDDAFLVARYFQWYS